MTIATGAAIEGILALGTPEQLRADAEQGKAPAGTPTHNAHIHLPPNFSAFESVDHAVEMAAGQGLRALGISNYYDYSVYADYARKAAEQGIFPLYGIEIIALDEELARDGVKMNDPGNPGKLYICGKGVVKFAPLTPRGQELLDLIRQKDSTRMAELIDRLEAIFAERGVATGLDNEAVIDRVVERHGSARETVYLQERHACQAFQERLFEIVPEAERAAKLEAVLGAAPADPANPVKVQNDIRSHLMKKGKSAYIDETFVTPKQAYELILEMGGIPCYPTLADGASPMSPYEDEVDKLIGNIKSAGIHMAEFIPIRNKPEVLEQYVTAMRAAGLAVAAGTEHNTLDLIPLDPACVGGAAVPEPVRAIFWEGACVSAAHQFMVAHGETGFVDAQGDPNPDYPDAETRIRAFATLGAALMQRYFENKG